MNTSGSWKEKNDTNSVEVTQNDLDDYLLKYNTKRPHQGRNMNGRTPEKVFREGLAKIKKQNQPKRNS